MHKLKIAMIPIDSIVIDKKQYEKVVKPKKKPDNQHIENNAKKYMKHTSFFKSEMTRIIKEEFQRYKFLAAAFPDPLTAPEIATSKNRPDEKK